MRPESVEAGIHRAAGGIMRPAIIRSRPVLRRPDVPHNAIEARCKEVVRLRQVIPLGIGILAVSARFGGKHLVLQLRAARPQAVHIHLIVLVEDFRLRVIHAHDGFGDFQPLPIADLRAGLDAVFVQPRAQRLQHPFAVELRLHVKEVVEHLFAHGFVRQIIAAVVHGIPVEQIRQTDGQVQVRTNVIALACQKFFRHVVAPERAAVFGADFQRIHEQLHVARLNLGIQRLVVQNVRQPVFLQRFNARFIKIVDAVRGFSGGVRFLHCALLPVVEQAVLRFGVFRRPVQRNRAVRFVDQLVGQLDDARSVRHDGLCLVAARLRHGKNANQLCRRRNGVDLAADFLLHGDCPASARPCLDVFHNVHDNLACALTVRVKTGDVGGRPVCAGGEGDGHSQVQRRVHCQLQVVIPLRRAVAVVRFADFVFALRTQLHAAKTAVVHRLNFRADGLVRMARFRHPPAHFAAVVDAGHGIAALDFRRKRVVLCQRRGGGQQQSGREHRRQDFLPREHNVLLATLSCTKWGSGTLRSPGKRD